MGKVIIARMFRLFPYAWLKDFTGYVNKQILFILLCNTCPDEYRIKYSWLFRVLIVD